MLNLVAAAAFFLALHLIVSGSSLRGRIVALTGERVYLALFSLASIGGIVWLCMAYNATDGSPTGSIGSHPIGSFIWPRLS